MSSDTGTADEILWRYTVTPVGDSPRLDAPVDNVEVRFTDADPEASHIDVSTQVKYLRAARSGSRPAGNVVTATVTDQYGQPFSGARVELAGDSSSTFPTAVSTGSSGTARIAYQHSGTRGLRETLTASLADGADSDTVEFLWAADPPFGYEETTGGGTYVVLAADHQRNEVVVDLAIGLGTPTVVVYDGNDRFRLDNRIVSLSVFESVLANELDSDDAGILLLGWTSRDPDNPADRTNWFLAT